MRGHGMRRSRPKALAGASAMALIAAAAGPGIAQGLDTPLTDAPGDPTRGRAIVADQAHGLCILCHPGPFPEHRFTGDLAPDLRGVGARLSVPELRQRIVDSRVVNPDTIMPPYHGTAELNRVGARWRGETILTAREVEDVVAYLATLDGDDP